MSAQTFTLWFLWFAILLILYQLSATIGKFITDDYFNSGYNIAVVTQELTRTNSVIIIISIIII